MARPRAFDEAKVLAATIDCFWRRGYEATSVRDLKDETGLTAASLYNAFGDKQALFRRALERYLEDGVVDRMARCERLAPRAAIETFFAEILAASLADAEHKGCLLVNTALDVAPHDPEIRAAVAATFERIEAFFRARVAAGQADGSIGRGHSPEALGRHFLGTLMGVRVLARVRPEPALLEGLVATALSLLDVETRA